MATLHRDTTHAVKIDGHWYELPEGEVVTINQLGIFERKFTVGDASADSDDYLSSLIMRDFSGGIGIEDSDEGADTTRFWFGVIDSRSPRMLAPPPKVMQVAGPQAGSPYPIGLVGTQFYMAFDNDVYGWNDTGNTWHVTANALGGAPVNKSVRFGPYVWAPLGSNGIDQITFIESNASNGTVTVDTSRATPTAVALAVWDNNLYAVDLDGKLWKLAVGSTTWGTVAPSSGVQVQLHTGETPKNLITYFDRSGAPTLWLITDRSAYMFNDSAFEWRQSNIQFPPHPDFGRSVAVWRPGEDLWIAAATDVVRQTTGNSVVPLSSGLSRDQGLPQQYRGVIKDLIPEISHLYALVGGVAESASAAWTYNDTIGSAGTGNGQFADASGVAVHPSTGYVYVADEDNHRIQVFDPALTYDSQFGTSGSGNGNFNSPSQVAFDSSGNIYVADRNNSRIVKRDASGSFLATFATAETPHGVAVDSSGNMYTAEIGGADLIRKYNSAGTLQWSVSPGTSGNLRHIATDGTHIYVVGTTACCVYKRLCSDGSAVATYGSAGSGDGQFLAPYGIALNPATGNIFVSDGTRDDVQELTNIGGFLRRFGATGSSNGQFNAPRGIGISADGDTVFVADSSNEDVQAFVHPTSGALSAYPTLHAWTGTGWHCLWTKGVATYVPTAGAISATTSHYRLWWGMSDEDAYYLDLRRTFYNPLQGFQAGLDHFATTGWLITSKFDAGMLGFDKVASKLTVFPHAATVTEPITIEYSIDDGGWELLGVVNAKRKWVFAFGTGGNTKGRVFNTIQFRFTVVGNVANDTLASLLKAATLSFVKVPQNARSQVFPIILPKQEKHPWGSARAQTDRLDALNSSLEFFDIEYGGRTYEHCRIAGITGFDQLSDGGGQRNVNVVHIPLDEDAA